MARGPQDLGGIRLPLEATDAFSGTFKRFRQEIQETLAALQALRSEQTSAGKKKGLAQVAGDLTKAQKESAKAVRGVADSTAAIQAELDKARRNIARARSAQARAAADEARASSDMTKASSRIAKTVAEAHAKAERDLRSLNRDIVDRVNYAQREAAKTTRIEAEEARKAAEERARSAERNVARELRNKEARQAQAFKERQRQEREIANERYRQARRIQELEKQQAIGEQRVLAETTKAKAEAEKQRQLAERRELQNAILRQKKERGIATTPKYTEAQAEKAGSEMLTSLRVREKEKRALDRERAEQARYLAREKARQAVRVDSARAGQQIERGRTETWKRDQLAGLKVRQEQAKAETAEINRNAAQERLDELRRKHARAAEAAATHGRSSTASARSCATTARTGLARRSRTCAASRQPRTPASATGRRGALARPTASST